jgi:hypothetical protein
MPTPLDYGQPETTRLPRWAEFLVISAIVLDVAAVLLVVVGAIGGFL